MVNSSPIRGTARLSRAITAKVRILTVAPRRTRRLRSISRATMTQANSTVLPSSSMAMVNSRATVPSSMGSLVLPVGLWRATVDWAPH